MAAEKTTKRRKQTAKTEGEEAEPREERKEAPAKRRAAPAKRTTELRLRTEPRQERRFEPAASTSVWVSVLALSIGSVLLGAGVYGQWLRAQVRPELTEPHPWAAYLLMAGALVFAAVAIVGPRPVKPLRVGDAGVGVDREPGDVQRLGWYEVSRVLLSGDVLLVQGHGTSISIPSKQHPQAAAHVLHEALARIPDQVEDVDPERLPAYDEHAGEVVPLEPAQLAGSRCKASDELIAFEKDARLCGRCGEVYHKAHVPETCLTCEARLK